MELNKSSMIVRGMTILLAVILFGALATYIGQVSESDEVYNNVDSTQTILTSSTDTLTPIGEGITSSEVKANNDTWLDFDGVNDYVSVNLDVFNSTTFWYKNETSDWIFVVNSSGTLYVNNVSETPNQYPVYYDGSTYFIGKNDSTHFFNGSMDDFRVYNMTLVIGDINNLYSGGRQ